MPLQASIAKAQELPSTVAAAGLVRVRRQRIGELKRTFIPNIEALASVPQELTASSVNSETAGQLPMACLVGRAAFYLRFMCDLPHWLLHRQRQFQADIQRIDQRYEFTVCDTQNKESFPSQAVRET